MYVFYLEDDLVPFSTIFISYNSRIFLTNVKKNKLEVMNITN